MHSSGISTRYSAYPKNLREAKRSINLENRRSQSLLKKSGLPLGVSYERRAPKRPYAARIHIFGKTKFLGLYETKEAAYNAYLNAKRILHEGCFI